MIRDVLDTHTHTIVSGHAYSTIRENAEAARQKGLKALGITEHAPSMPGSCHEFYFINFKVIPREAYGVRLFMGVELNIVDYDGTVDLSEYYLKRMDIVIASLHGPCIKPGTMEENTRAVLKAMENPYVNIIAHPDDANYPLDYEKVVLGAKKNHVLLELNNSSLKPGGARGDFARDLDIQMLKLCMEHEVPIAMGSDAHVDADVGNHDRAIALLEELNFPEHLVVNRSVEALEEFLNPDVQM